MIRDAKLTMFCISVWNAQKQSRLILILAKRCTEWQVYLCTYKCHSSGTLREVYAKL